MSDPGIAVVREPAVRRTFLLWAALTSAGAAAEPWPELPVPPRAQVQWVGDSMRINGIPTRVARFESSLSKQEIVAFFRAHWAADRDRPPPAVDDVDGATVVGQAHGPYYMMAQVRARGRDASEGLLSVARVLGSEVKLDPGEVAVMPNAKVLSVVESEDPGRRSRYVVMWVEAATETARRFYETALAQRGWQLVQQGGPPPAELRAQVPHGFFAIYQRGAAARRERAELQLGLVAEQRARGVRGTTIVANLITHDVKPELTR